MTFDFYSTIINVMIIFIILSEEEFSRFKNKDNEILEKVFLLKI